jgi:hypothetical protein
VGQEITMNKTALALLALTAFACSAQTDEADLEGAADDDDDGVETESSDISIAGRWTLTSAVRAAGMRQSVSYDSADECADGDQPGTKKMKAYLRSKFPNEIDHTEGFVCRNIRGSSGLSMHATGRAMDIFIDTVGGSADNTKGDRVAEFLIRNAEAIGVQFIIWDRSKWKPGQDATPYGGVHSHNDHLHVELTEEAGAMRTAFFRGGPVDNANSGTTAGGGGGGGSSGDGCYSFTLKEQVREKTCVQASSNRIWYRCEAGSWKESSASDSKCGAKHPL